MMTYAQPCISSVIDMYSKLDIKYALQVNIILINDGTVFVAVLYLFY